MSPLKAAVIGAGPAGCLLARILLQAGLQVTVFEAEEALDCRSQGGTLDLHPKTGIAALKAAGVYDEVAKLARPASAGLKIADKQLRIYFYIPAEMHGTPEVDRRSLRALLLDSIPPEIIRWDHCLERVDDARSLYFTNGKFESGYDVVVGADGAWSNVRRALTEQTPVYSGLAGYDTSISDASRKVPESCKIVNGGSLFSFSDAKSILAQQMGDGVLSVSVWGRRPEDWIEASRRQSIAYTDLLEGYDDWAPNLRNLILHADGEIRTTALYMLPVGFKWHHRSGMTLVGDAAHLMTPFGGEGVNLALEDAWKLGEAIVKASNDANTAASLDRAVIEYEAEMFKRAHRAQKMTVNMMKAMYFTKGAPRTGIEHWTIARVYYDAPPVLATLLYPVLVTGIYSTYFWIKLFIR